MELSNTKKLEFHFAQNISYLLVVVVVVVVVVVEVVEVVVVVVVVEVVVDECSFLSSDDSSEIIK